MEEPARPLLEHISEGGPIIMGLYLMIVGAVVAVSWVRIRRSRHGNYAPSLLPTVLAFAPLLFASFGAFLCLFSIRSVLMGANGLSSLQGAIGATSGGYLILGAGWFATAVALLIAYFPSHTKVA